MYNAMALALSNVGFEIPNTSACKFKEGWNVSLSYRTYKKLESEGYTKFQG